MKRIIQWIKNLFYVPKHEKASDTLFLRIMLSSVFGMLICGICLTGLTWAWFSGSVTSAENNITAAEFSVTTTFKNNNGDTVNPTLANGSYTLDSGDYTVTVSATGTATTGFCSVKLKLSDGSKVTYHTVQLYPAGGDGKPQSVEFTVNASGGEELTITPQWGTFGNSTGQRIGNKPSDLSSIPPDAADEPTSELAEEQPTDTENNTDNDDEPHINAGAPTEEDNSADESEEDNSTDGPDETEPANEMADASDNSPQTDTEESTVS